MTFTFGIFGAGMATKPHLEAFQKLSPEIKLKGITSRSVEKSIRLSKENSIFHYPDAESMAKDPELDAVLIATPPNARLDYVELFAKAGKHILLEKPIERTTQAAIEIVSICEKSNIFLGIVLQHRYRTASLQLKLLLDPGNLGAVHAVNIQVPWWREQSYYDPPGRGTYERDGGGVLITQAIHTLDLLLYLLGPIDQVKATGGTSKFHKMEAEDFVNAGLIFQSGAFGSLFATTSAFPGSSEKIEIYAELATAKLGGGSLSVHWKSGKTDHWKEEGGSGSGSDPMAFSCEPHRELISEFSKSVRDGHQPGINGRNFLSVHRLIEQLASSIRSPGLSLI